MIRIYPLNEKKSLYPILAYWSFNNWYMGRDVPFRYVLQEYSRRADNESLPYSFVACMNDLPVGMVSIKYNDMLNRPDLSPWLSALYVAPEYRNTGIGGLLISTVLQDCADNGIQRIFLFVDSRYRKKLSDYYSGLGWIFLDEEKDSDGNATRIYFYETGNRQVQAGR